MDVPGASSVKRPVPGRPLACHFFCLHDHHGLIAVIIIVVDLY